MLGWNARRLLAQARRASRVRDWPAAARKYAAFLELRPEHHGAWVQFGHAMKEQGDLSGARTAYESAVARGPEVADNWLQYGHILKLLRDRSAAIDAYATAARLDPKLEPAADELVAMGMRDRLPDGSCANDREDPYDSSRYAELEFAIGDHLDEARRPGVYPPTAYNRFRRQLAIPPPPRFQTNDEVIHVMVEGRGALPAEVKSTLSSLLDQVYERWTAIVVADPEILDHSVASLQILEKRISFTLPDAAPNMDAGRGYLLFVAAGTVLDRNAIAWFAFAAQRTGCVAAYCDHDRSVDEIGEGRRFDLPMFQPMYDRVWFENPEATPAALFINSTLLLAGREAGWDARRNLLRLAGQGGGVAHVPLLLASIKSLPREAETALADTPALRRLAADEPLAAVRAGASDLSAIQVIVQTRDEADLLDVCISSLKKLASHPRAIDFTIVDNRSVLPSTQRLLNKLSQNGATVISLDEPFNWARANNLAAERSAAPYMLFLNNDMEMLTPGWDDRLRADLAMDDVGVLGALLLYPDRTIQHAGMICGMGKGIPTHEGVGRDGGEPGPGGRWLRRRSASAVTGAFMAMRRSVFADIGRLDAVNFAIAFNDVDLCLRVRAAGLRVLQTPEVSLIHYESKTRGMNFTRSRIAWDLEEFSALYRRWGAWLFTDPGYNPHWTRYGHPFDGYRFPGVREVVRHIDLSSKPDPWRVTAAGGASRSEWW